MKYPEDLTGLKFTNLTVLGKVEGKQIEGCSVWRCRCDCGKEIEVGRKVLVVGRKKSCGCQRYKQRISVHCVKCGKVEQFETKFSSKDFHILCEDCLKPILEKVEENKQNIFDNELVKVSEEIKKAENDEKIMKKADIWADKMANAKPEDFEN